MQHYNTEILSKEDISIFFCFPVLLYNLLIKVRIRQWVLLPPSTAMWYVLDRHKGLTYVSLFVGWPVPSKEASIVQKLNFLIKLLSNPKLIDTRYGGWAHKWSQYVLVPFRCWSTPKSTSTYWPHLWAHPPIHSFRYWNMLNLKQMYSVSGRNSKL